MHLVILILRVFCGLVFLISAYFKLASINAFEIYVYSVFPFPMTIAYIGARLLIGFEAILGLFLFFGIQFNKIRVVTIAVLFLFSFFLILQIFSGKEDNCFCFGEALPMQPYESLIKNFALIGILLFLRKHTPGTFLNSKPVYIILSTGMLAIPFIISPVDSWLQGRYSQYGEFDTSVLEHEFQSATYADIPIQEGKKIVCFFSMSCEYCKLTSEKLSAVSEKTDMNKHVIYIFFGAEKNLHKFWEESNSKKFPSYIIDVNAFFRASGPGLPAIYFLEEGKAVKKFGYRTLDDKAIEEFLEN